MDGKRQDMCERRCKELLRFLLVKTAAARRGVKPAELLRVRHCYAGADAAGRRVCLLRRDVYSILGLDYIELAVDGTGALVLFYNPQALKATLSDPANARWLEGIGYPAAGAPDGFLPRMLAHLSRRAAACGLPHEVGVFIGYPLKDVAGFMRRGEPTPVGRGAWRVYGGAEESLERMRLYAKAEEEAREAFARARGVEDFIGMITLDRAV